MAKMADDIQAPQLGTQDIYLLRKVKPMLSLSILILAIALYWVVFHRKHRKR